MTAQPELSIAGTMPPEMMVAPSDFMATLADIKTRGGAVTSFEPPWYHTSKDIPMARRNKWLFRINWQAKCMLTCEQALAAMGKVGDGLDARPRRGLTGSLRLHTRQC